MGQTGEVIPEAVCHGVRSTKVVIVRTPSEDAAALEAMSEVSTLCPSSSSRDSDSSSGNDSPDGWNRRRKHWRHGSPKPTHRSEQQKSRDRTVTFMDEAYKPPA